MASSQTFRFLMSLLAATVVLHITNYMYYSVYLTQQDNTPKLDILDMKIGNENYLEHDFSSFIEVKPINIQPASFSKHEISTGIFRSKLIGNHGNSTKPIEDLEQNFTLATCVDMPKGLGLVDSKSRFTKLNGIPYVIDEGGSSKPKDCIAIQSVAVIVPYISKDDLYLELFLYMIHPLLIKQQLDYKIYVVQPTNQTMANDTTIPKGLLLNIGFEAAQQDRPGGYSCYIFHSVQLVPKDERNLYRCSKGPKQLVTEVEVHGPIMDYIDRVKKRQVSFGGVLAMTEEHVRSVNGFSNKITSLNGEFEDMYSRIISAKLDLERSPKNVSNFESYVRDYPAVPVSTKTTSAFEDGLSRVTRRNVTLEMKPLYTSVKVNDLTV